MTERKIRTMVDATSEGVRDACEDVLSLYRSLGLKACQDADWTLARITDDALARELELVTGADGRLLVSYRLAYQTAAAHVVASLVSLN